MLGAPLSKSISELGRLSVKREGENGGESETVLFSTTAKGLLDDTGAPLHHHGPAQFRQPLEVSLLDEHYVVTDMLSNTAP